MSAFRPVIYLKESCPFCLKVAAFLAESGHAADYELRTFWPDDEREQAIRGELAPHFEAPSFPAMQVAPGRFLKESDAIVALLAEQTGCDSAAMPIYSYMLSGPFRRMREQFAQIRELSQRLEPAA